MRGGAEGALWGAGPRADGRRWRQTAPTDLGASTPAPLFSPAFICVHLRLFVTAADPDDLAVLHGHGAQNHHTVAGLKPRRDRDAVRVTRTRRDRPVLGDTGRRI